MTGAKTKVKVTHEDSIAVEVVSPDRRMARVGAETLPFAITDNEARGEAEALGAWLGMTRANHARELARALQRRGILNDSDIIRQREQNTRERGRPATEAWLSRAGALKFAAHSRTPKAAQLLDLIVRVFLAVVDGGDPVEINRSLRGRVAELEERLEHGVVGDLVGARLLERARSVARLLADEPRQVASKLRTVLNHFQHQIPFVGPGSSMGNLPLSELAAAERLLSVMECRAREYRRAHPYPALKQLQLAA